MTYEVLYTEDQLAVEARIDLLGEHGPALGRPTVDTLAGSRLPT